MTNNLKLMTTIKSTNTNNNTNNNCNNETSTLVLNGNDCDYNLLTQEEEDIIQEYDSRLFGFIKLENQENNAKKCLLLKAIQTYEKKLLDDNNDKQIEAKLNLKLGHWYLLLNDFKKSLSSYQKYFQLSDNSYQESTFLYGIGLVYLYFGAFKFSQKSFLTILYNDPGFLRSNEINLRLGLIYKDLNKFDYSLKHLKLALVDLNTNCISKQEIKFCIGHLYETNLNYLEALNKYNDILKSDDLNAQFKAKLLRQIGWLYYYAEELNTIEKKSASTSDNLLKSIEFLTKSIELDHLQCLTWYYLGRVHSQKGNVRDAFNSYRNSVNSTESNADTWCSIGVLYQQQNQAMDALQAYICAVQLDSKQYSAWLNLAILYETLAQYDDSLNCYLKTLDLIKNNENLEKILNERIKILRNLIQKTDAVNVVKKIPSLNDAFSLPIPAELTAKQANGKTIMSPQVAQQQQLQQPPTKKQKISKKNEQIVMTNQQIQLMHQLELNKSNLNPDQVQMLNYLKNQFTQIQQQQQQQIYPQQTQFRPMLNRPSITQSNHLQSDINHELGLPQDLEHVNPTMNSTQVDLNLLLSHHDITDDLRNIDLDNILTNKIQQNKKIDLKKSLPIHLIKLDPLLLPDNDTASEPQLNINMSTTQIIKACKTFGLNGVLNTCILPPNCKNPIKINTTKILSQEALNPVTPSVILESKKDALSSQLQHYCISNPITVVRGISGVLKLDLSLFSTKSLVHTHPDHLIEIRTQRQQPSDENWDLQGKQRVWKCESSKSTIKLSKYAQYQASTFQENLKLEYEQQQMQQYNQQNEKFKIIKFGTNVDLSDETKWKPQLAELAKLPPFMKVISPCNMLSHVGYTILGMNTVQLYMKVPGSRTPGHQENNNFCSLNINIGPGDCEWFGVSQAYWQLIEELCEKNNVDYLTGSWWPKLEDLAEANIPVYRFIQKPGDLVWVNSGCVHWVQSIGWCNNIAWNVGPLVYTQYKSAIERYEWNKFKLYKSIVPIIHLTWNIAKNIKISDYRLYELIKYVLMISLKQTCMSINFIENCGLELRSQLRLSNEQAHYCIDCECEVFNILFVSENENDKSTHVVYCQNCARRRSPTLDNFVILNQFTMEELKSIYDNFILYSPAIQIQQQQIHSQQQQQQNQQQQNQQQSH